MVAKLTNVTTSCETLKVQFQQDATKAKEELNTLQAKYEMGEAQIKALVAKHQLKLNKKVEEVLAQG